MSDKKSEKVGPPVPPADTLIKSSKDGSVELAEEDLAKVTGGVKTIVWNKGG